MCVLAVLVFRCNRHVSRAQVQHLQARLLKLDHFVEHSGQWSRGPPVQTYDSGTSHYCMRALAVLVRIGAASQ